MFGEGIGRAINALIVLVLVAIPFTILGIWKLVEIIGWLITNVKITIGA
jgi:hypothetical protein